MKAEINRDGRLVIIPENSTESFALQHWLKTASKELCWEARDSNLLAVTTVTTKDYIDPERLVIQRFGG